MSGELIALVSCPSGKGQELAKILVSEKLAACINVIPGLRSVYLWKDELVDDAEELMLAKTDKNTWNSFAQRVREIHPYEVPEIICIVIEDGYVPYLDWLKSSLKK